jgi:hypothetical protein
LTHHLGYEKGAASAGRSRGNSRNGHTAKEVLTDDASLDLSIPRNRAGTFEPKLVPKGLIRLEGFEVEIVSLYPRGLSVLNDYSFGAYPIAHGDRPFIDSRADMYGDAFLGRFREIADQKDGALAAALAEWPIAWTIFGPDSAVVPLLDRQPGWRRLFADNTAVVRVAVEAARGFAGGEIAR